MTINKCRIKVCSSRLLLLILGTYLQVGLSSGCDNIGILEDELSEVLFPLKDYSTSNDKKTDRINPAWLFKLNDCLSMYDRSIDSLIFYGSSCTVIPTIQISNVHISSKISIKWTSVNSLTSDSFSKWGNVSFLDVVENDQLESIRNGAFSDMWNLIKLKITDNPKLVTLQPNAFDDLINLEELSLARNSIFKMADVTFNLNLLSMPNLNVLDVSGNPIDSINDNDFNNFLESFLSKLIINDINFKQVGSSPFNSLPNLQSISIGSKYPDKNTIKLLESVNQLLSLNEIYLHNIDISGNNEILTQTIVGTFYKKIVIRDSNIGVLDTNKDNIVSVLNHIEITNSLMREFPKIIFNKSLFPNINKIILRSNNLHSIPNIEDTSVVKLLDLSGNKFKQVNERSFTFAPNLEVLILTDTGLEYIGKNSFKNNKQLVALIINRNNFQQSSLIFTKYIFSGLENLKALDLSENKIREFKNNNLFDYLFSLQFLSLKSNNLKHFDDKLIENLSCLRKLDLRNNNFFVLDPAFFKVNNLLTDIGVFSSLYVVDYNLVRWLELLLVTNEESNLMNNCTNLEIMTAHRDVVITQNVNSYLYDNNCTITLMIDETSNDSEDFTDYEVTTIDSQMGNTSKYHEGSFEFIYILFRPIYVCNNLSSSNFWSILRFLYVILFYLIIFGLLIIIVIKLISFVLNLKKKKKHGLIFEEKIDYCGIENKGFGIPYEQMKPTLVVNEEKSIIQ